MVGFFDTVNHDRLMGQLRSRVRDRQVLGLIRRYLQAGVELPDGTREATPQGVPQGGPLSPLLANIVLDPLDKELEKRGHWFARYADDFLVMVKSARAAERVMAGVTRFVEGKLKLTVNPTKSRCAPLKECAFLGFQIGARGKAVWTEKARARFQQRVREITSRSRGHRVQTVITELRRYVVGWLNYFGVSHTYRVLLELEEMGPPAGEVVLLEAMEAAPDATAAIAGVGHSSRPGEAGLTQPQRLLAHERQQQHRANGADQPQVAGARGSQHEATVDRDSLS